MYIVRASNPSCHTFCAALHFDKESPWRVQVENELVCIEKYRWPVVGKYRMVAAVTFASPRNLLISNPISTEEAEQDLCQTTGCSGPTFASECPVFTLYKLTRLPV